MKQLISMNWWQMKTFRERDAIICDGSIRSGKTISMTVGFVLWSMSQFDDQVFAICGKTIESLRRNVILHMPQWLEGIFSVQERRSENRVTITGLGRRNTYFLFGGKDEGSAALIQGMTLAGVLFDEVALMPRSFVEQAMARCSVEGSRYWFNCNPESPAHWFYTEWIKGDQPIKKNALHLHFTMDDNLTLSPKVRKRYENQYAGVFYERFILGRWKIAEGLVYPFFAADPGRYLYTGHIEGLMGAFYVSIDYGTHNPCSMGLWCVNDHRAIRIAESYYDSRKERKQRTDEEHYAQLDQLAAGRHIRYVVVDPSAASFIETIRRHGKFHVLAADNHVLNGIRVTAALMNAGRLLIHESCKDSLEEFQSYCWDDKAQEDKVVKENDHAMDDIRYFANTVLAREYRWADWKGV